MIKEFEMDYGKEKFEVDYMVLFGTYNQHPEDHYRSEKSKGNVYETVEEAAFKARGYSNSTIWEVAHALDSGDIVFCNEIKIEDLIKKYIVQVNSDTELNFENVIWGHCECIDDIEAIDKEEALDLAKDHLRNQVALVGEADPDEVDNWMYRIKENSDEDEWEYFYK